MKHRTADSHAEDMPNQRKSLETKSAGGLVYPFSAIVAQDEMKLALILNVIDPSIGGVLMMGHRGTGKSTAVRALADLLPELWVVLSCRYNCDPAEPAQFCAECAARSTEREKLPRVRAAVPVVDLPLGATEDRVCGSIDIERALQHGVKAFDPGLLARAHRGFLYIDEVNLLEDHLVDLLLDVAVTGRNKVERENISIEHAARFVLIGSGNPEEGELRPQLLDRFGLYVEVKTENEPEQRVEIMEKREAFDRNPEKFRSAASAQQDQLRRQIERARKSFAGVKVERKLLRQIATVCSELKVDGHRGELTIMRSARARAAFAGRRSVSEKDVFRVATMALRHRLHRDPLGETGTSVRIEQALEKVFGPAAVLTSDGGPQDPTENTGKRKNKSARRGSSVGAHLRVLPGQTLRSAPTAREGDNGSGATGEAPTPPAVDAELPGFSLSTGSGTMSSKGSVSRGRQGGLRRTSYNSQRGRYARAVSLKRFGARIALDATLRVLLQSGSDFAAADLRFKEFAQKRGTLFIFAIDASGSMALNRINQAKGALLRLLKQSYINRDSVAIVGFRGERADVLLPPSRSIVRARRVLDTLSIGGGTPLSAGLACSLELARRAKAQELGEIALLLFTDGHANVPLRGSSNKDRAARDRQIAIEIVRLGAALRALAIQTVIVGTHNTFLGSTKARSLAETLGAQYLQVASVAARPPSDLIVMPRA